MASSNPQALFVPLRANPKPEDFLSRLSSSERRKSHRYQDAKRGQLVDRSMMTTLRGLKSKLVPRKRYKKVILGLCWGYVGIVENEITTTILQQGICRVYIGVMEKKMDQRTRKGQWWQ